MLRMGAWVAAATLTVGLAACGSDDDVPTSSEGDQSGAVTIALAENAFTPAMISATPGEPLEVELHNEGRVEHTFTIESLDIDETLAAGARSSVVIDPGDTGTIEFICTIHVGVGMRGVINVGAAVGEAPTSAAPSTTNSLY